MSSPFVKQPSTELISLGLIVSAVGRQIVDAHAKLKLIRQEDILRINDNPDFDEGEDDDGKGFYIVRPKVDGGITEIL